MSLNRAEQMLFDYVSRHAEEKRHWHEKVRWVASRWTDSHGAAVALEGELWRYYEERSRIAEPFREVIQREGLRRISLRNLAEHLLRLWSPSRPKRPATEEKTNR